MACNINCKKVIVGGLVAGVFINAMEIFTHAFLLGNRYAELTKMGLYHKDPALPFFVYNLIALGCGIAVAWLYAVSRDTLGPGPLTALKVGLVVWFVAALPAQYAAATWQMTGKMIPFLTTIAVFIECTIGTLIAAAIYRPSAQAS